MKPSQYNISFQHRPSWTPTNWDGHPLPPARPRRNSAPVTSATNAAAAHARPRAQSQAQPRVFYFGPPPTYPDSHVQVLRAFQEHAALMRRRELGPGTPPKPKRKPLPHMQRIEPQQLLVWCNQGKAAGDWPARQEAKRLILEAAGLTLGQCRHDVEIAVPVGSVDLSKLGLTKPPPGF